MSLNLPILVKLPRVAGIGPFKLFSSSRRVTSPGRLPSEEGISPVKSLSARSITSSMGFASPNVTGILPVRRLWSNRISLIIGHSEKMFSIGPSSCMSRARKTSMSVSSLISAGIVPFSIVRFLNPTVTSAGKKVSSRESRQLFLRLHGYFLIHTVSDEINCLHIPISVAVNSIPIANVGVG